MRQVADLPLWLGHVGDARDHARLHDLGIVAVVDLADSESPVVHPRSFVTLRFPLLDGAGNPPGILRLAVRATADLIRDRIPTLVHCSAGMSRTPALAAAALAEALGIPCPLALRLVTRDGPVDITPALWADLLGVLIPGPGPDISSVNLG